MPADEIVDVPLVDPNLKVRVIALRKAKTPGPFQYLQGMRQGTLQRLFPNPEDSDTAHQYHRRERQFFAMLAESVPGEIDAVLSPPSRMAWQAEPYRQAVATAHPKAVDLTKRMDRTGSARAGEGASLKEVMAGLSYDPMGGEKNFTRIVIVDDTFTTGTTAAAIALLLRQHGLPDGEVICACPLWLDTFSPKGS